MAKHLAPRENVSSLGPAMQAIAERERIFVEAFVEGGGDRGAIRAAVIAASYGQGSTDHVRDSIGARLLQTQTVQDAIAEVVKARYRSELPAAVKAISEVLRTPFHKDRAKVAQNLIDRVDVPVSHTSTDINVNVKVDHDAEAIAELRLLKSMNVARERLEDIFGFGGLQKFEQLLAIEDQKSKVIDATFTEVQPNPDKAELGEL